ESEYLAVPLTTIKQPISEMCQIAIRFLLNRINGQVSEPQQVTLKPTLLVRQSSGGLRNP
ncbi:MAG: substrate-binding domain-containing protein, partial [Armatimonadota bacterium]|nr:substrate-binding domain-containing protein [Armatimonadota bacterium]